MRVSELMTHNVCLARPDQTIREAARMMADEDIGCLPVGDADRLVGMLTDRDIAVRAVAQGKSPDNTMVRDVMSQEIRYCFEDEDIDHVAENMGDIQVHRLPVVNREKRLVGILTLADIAKGEGPEMVGRTVVGISEGSVERRH